jgi:Ni,Fe-hydrogenase III small subunit
MRKFLVTLSLFLVGTVSASAGVWKNSCAGCHNGRVAPLKEELLSKYPTPESFLKAVNEAIKEEKMPPRS